MSESKTVYPVCFWCDAVFEEPVTLGNEFTQEEKDALPDKCVMHYDPCPNCMIEWVQGRVFIEYDDEMSFESQPTLERPDGTKFYPTGRLVVISPEKATAMFGGGNDDVEPISFLNKENFAAAFQRQPVILCFWCGEPVDGVKPAEKRIKVAADYEPCPACIKKYEGKSVLFECDYVSDKAIRGLTVQVDGKSLYPTGRLMRLDYKEAARLLGPDTGRFV
jgi:hypothetical protein